MNVLEGSTTDPAQRALPDADAQQVAALLEATADTDADLWTVLTEPNPDRLIDQVFKDEVHAPRA